MITKDVKVGTIVQVDQPRIENGRAVHDYYWISRLVEWCPITGLPRIATPCERNPHCCEWPYTCESLTVIDHDDWVLDSKFKIGQQVHFVYELEGFHGMKVGHVTPATLKCPHIAKGAWIVTYPRHDNGLVIVRCLNEIQMLVPGG